MSGEVWNLLAKSTGRGLNGRWNWAKIDLERNVVNILEAATGSSLLAKGCIIGVGFDRIALVVRITGIQELLQPVSVDRMTGKTVLV